MDAVDGDGTKGVLAFNIYLLPKQGEKHGKPQLFGMPKALLQSSSITFWLFFLTGGGGHVS